ncbi:MAG: pyridoxal-phosphate dependent enzyme [Thermoflexales bacterium]|nr:pyridoxal-phosphate dependent enzyme [Thermoflexales bacterium]
MVTLSDIQAARARIAPAIVRTPLVPLPGVSNPDLLLKLESLQPMGAFKLRGAYNALASLSAAERAAGVIAHSSGNHAQAVAYAARALGIRATIVMPRNAPAIKLERTKAYGANVVLVGNASTERAKKCAELAAQHGYEEILPFDDTRVIAGQGTLGVEIAEDAPQTDLVLVPVSGGGLISGVAVAIKSLLPNARVVGVEPSLASDAQASLRAGLIVAFPADQTAQTMADGLRVHRLGDVTWPHIKEYVDDIVTVSEEEIEEAMRALAFQGRVLSEPSGAVTTAAWLYHRGALPEAKHPVAVVSGGNIDTAQLVHILGKGHDKAE